MKLDDILHKMKEKWKITLSVFLFITFLTINFFVGNKNIEENSEEMKPAYEVGEKINFDEADGELDKERKVDYQALYLNKIENLESEKKTRLEALEKENLEIKSEMEKMKEQNSGKFDRDLSERNPQDKLKNYNSPFGMPVTSSSSSSHSNTNGGAMFDNSNNEVMLPPEKTLYSIEWVQPEKTTLPTIKELKKKEIVKENNESKKVETEKTIWIPSNSIFMVKTDNGIQAPTLSSGEGKNFAHTTTVIVTDIFLPNGYRYNLKGGKVLLESKGSLSSHRAETKTVRLSAVNKKREIMDIPIEGYLSDFKSGMQGIQGEVVSKQEELFWGAVVAYATANIGSAYQNKGTETITNAVGGTSTVNNKGATDTLKGGLYGGVGKGAEEVGKHILDIAKSIEPVIEVLGKQYAVIHITQPFKIQYKVSEVSNEKQIEKTK